MDFDFRLARANDFSGTQEIFTHYENSTRMAPARNIASTITRLQQSLGFPDFSDNNDETPAYPIYLPVPMVVARRIMLDGSEEPKVVGYAYMGPTHRLTDNRQSSMELFLFVHPDYVRRGIGGALLSMLLNLVHSYLGLRCYDWVLVGPFNSVHTMRKNVNICRIVAAVTLDPETEDGGEWLPLWLETKGFVEYKRSKRIGANSDQVVETAYLKYNVLEEADSSDDSDSAAGYGDDEAQHNDDNDDSSDSSDGQSDDM